MKLKVYDNDGKTFDRYTIIIDDEVIGVSLNPDSPNGFCCHCCHESELNYDPDSIGERAPFNGLPDNVRNMIIQIIISEIEEEI